MQVVGADRCDIASQGQILHILYEHVDVLYIEGKLFFSVKSVKTGSRTLEVQHPAHF